MPKPDLALDFLVYDELSDAVDGEDSSDSSYLRFTLFFVLISLFLLWLDLALDFLVYGELSDAVDGEGSILECLYAGDR